VTQKSNNHIPHHYSKEISWLYFNERVLNEANDNLTPLMERAKFLGIYSNNLDEFFRVRVATLNRLARMPRKKAIGLVGHDPHKTLKMIHRMVIHQSYKFDMYFQRLLKDLAEQNIFIVDEKKLNSTQAAFVRDYFHRIVRSKLFPVMINRVGQFPDLRDRSIYLAIALSRKGERDKPQYALVEIPTDVLSRFVLLPKHGPKQHVILLEDVIRFNLRSIFAPFGYDRFAAYTIKLTRDAELDIDDDIFESYARKIHKSLRQRKEGRPVRLVYDQKIPKALLKLIAARLQLGKKDPMIPGGRYHNIKDFMRFPKVGGESLRYEAIPALQHREILAHASVFQAVAAKDILVHLPYHTFDHIIDMLQEASIDPEVKSIKITLYRAAQNSSIVNALLNAAKNGKSVVAVVELQARFDEEANIHWATELQEAGAKVVFGVPGLKVHAKICLITREDGRGIERFAMVGTGNFNEDTAMAYTDHFLLTADERITKQVADIFNFLEHNYRIVQFRHLIVSPFAKRRRFTKLIQNEIDNAKQSREAWILLKLNHLTDTEMIKWLYKASQAGVKIRLLIRGMFTLQPGKRGLSENIEAKQLIDMYLEHARVLFFCNGGDQLCYISSADWMPRNLDRRMEVTCPIYEDSLKRELRDIFELQWKDNVKCQPHIGAIDTRASSAAKRKTYKAQVEIDRYLARKR